MIGVHRVFESASQRSPLVLLHGFPLSSKMWDDVVPLLEASLPDRSLLLIDFPGFDRSSYEASWSMQSFAEELAVEIKKITTDGVILGGLSMGGYAALALYREHPKLVSGMILSNTKAAADTSLAKIDREVFALDTEKRGTESAIERMLPKFLVPSVVQAKPELPERLKAMIRECDPKAIAAALRAMAVREDSTALLGTIAAPVLVIAGEHDPFFTPDDAAALASHIPNGMFTLLHGAGHLSSIDTPIAWVEAVANFLRSSEIA